MPQKHTYVPEPSTLQEFGRSYQSFVAYMTPEDFLQGAYTEILGRYRNSNETPPVTFTPRSFLTKSESSIKQLKKRLYEGKPIDIPLLEVSDAAENDCSGSSWKPTERAESCKLKLTGGGEITAHEGRHRAIASEEVGIEEIPVRIEVRGLKDWHENEKIYHRSDLQKELLRNVGIRAHTAIEHASEMSS